MIDIIELSNDQRSVLNNFIDRCFRDIADQDYISARNLYKYNLFIQCIWLSSQSIEKYLKAILVYNNISVLNNKNHDLVTLLGQLDSIEKIEFDFDNDVIDFIKYINDECENRYFSFPYIVKRDYLYLLDKTVWNLRRYCKYVEYNEKETFSRIMKLAYLKNNNKYPCKIALFNGFIEQIINSKKDIRSILVWKNMFFGKNRKRIIRNFPQVSATGIPTHYIFKESIDYISKYVYIPKKVVGFIKSK